jgi:hypothetical protein
MEIIVNSSYVLRNMEIYTRVPNMVWTRGIWSTTQSENIISPPNKDKLPITNMQISLEQYPGFNQSQNIRGTRWILEIEMVMMMVLMEMLMERPLPTPKRSDDDNGIDFPLTEGCSVAGSTSAEQERTFSFIAASIYIGKNMA